MTAKRLCEIDGCNKPHYGRGYCSAHWKRFYRYGDPSLGNASYIELGDACVAEGCDRKPIAKNFCLMHYKRWRKHGDAAIRLVVHSEKGAAMDFLENVVLLYQGDDCLKWPFGDRGNGYGCLNYEGKSQNVHRIVCRRIHGEPPTKEHIACHSCGKGHEGCCNPNHIFWGTPKSNQADRLIHGTHGRGERCGTSKLTAQQVIEIRSRYRSKGATKIAAEVAKDFGIAVGTVYGIWYRKAWYWL